MNNELKKKLHALFLAHSADIVDEHIQNAVTEERSYEDFLSHLLDAEIGHRKTRRIEARVRQAHIPIIKNVEHFNFSFPQKIPKQLILSLLNCKYIAEKKNIIFLGPPGVGKTHLSSALSYQACMNDINCRFITAINLINELTASISDNTFLKCLKRFTRYELLVIDELGYLPVDKQGCDLFFQVISNRYEMGSVIVTTNKPFREWGEIFNGDSILAGAIIDRLVHHGEVIKIEGESYRVRK